MPPITARYIFTLDDLLAGRKRVLKVGRALAYFIVMTGIVIALAIRMLGGPPRHFSLEGVAAAIGLLIFAILVAVPSAKMINYLIIRNQFRKRPDLTSEVEWKFSEQNIIITSPTSTSECQWTAFQKIISTPEGIIFMPNAQIFSFVPIRAFDSAQDFEAVTALARRHASDFKELN
jgi:hypothetical protein